MSGVSLIGRFFSFLNVLNMLLGNALQLKIKHILQLLKFVEYLCSINGHKMIPASCSDIHTPKCSTRLGEVPVPLMKRTGVMIKFIPATMFRQIPSHWCDRTDLGSKQRESSDLWCLNFPELLTVILLFIGFPGLKDSQKWKKSDEMVLAKCFMHLFSKWESSVVSGNPSNSNNRTGLLPGEWDAKDAFGNSGK